MWFVLVERLNIYEQPSVWLTEEAPVFIVTYYIHTRAAHTCMPVHDYCCQVGGFMHALHLWLCEVTGPQPKLSRVMWTVLTCLCGRHMCLIQKKRTLQFHISLTWLLQWPKLMTTGTTPAPQIKIWTCHCSEPSPQTKHQQLYHVLNSLVLVKLWVRVLTQMTGKKVIQSKQTVSNTATVGSTSASLYKKKLSIKVHLNCLTWFQLASFVIHA